MIIRKQNIILILILIAAIAVLSTLIYGIHKPINHIVNNNPATDPSQGYYINSSFFGITFNPPYQTSGSPVNPWPNTQLGALGKTNDASWVQIEPSPNTYNWNLLDNVISQAQQHGINTFVYTFLNVPEWAETNTLSCTTKSGSTVSCTGPPNMDDWNAFVSNVAIRYKGTIQYYEMWNEPNGGGQGTFWTGNYIQLVNMTKNAYSIIKAINPNAIIVSPGVTASAVENANGGWMQEYLQGGGNQYVGAVAWHAYMRPYSSVGCEDDILLDCAATPLVMQIENAYSIMALSGAAGKPLMDTEGGIYDTFTPNQSVEGAVLSRWYIIQASYGVKLAVWYAYSTNPPQQSTYSLNASEQKAYNQTYTWLVGSTIYPCNPNNIGVWTCNIISSSGSKEQLAWFQNSTTLYSPGSSYTKYQALNGSVYNINNGKINLGIAPLLLYGQSVSTTTSSTTSTGSSTSTTTSTSTSSTTTMILGIPSLAATNTPSIGVGQYEVFTANLPPAKLGTAPYKYNYQIINSITKALLSNQLYVGVSGSTNTFAWSVPGSLAGNTITANVIITDSEATPNTVNSVYTAAITITSQQQTTVTTTSSTTTSSTTSSSTTSPSTTSSTSTTTSTSTSSTTTQCFFLCLTTTSTLTTSISSVSTTSTSSTTSTIIPMNPITTKISDGYIVYYISQGDQFSVSLCNQTMIIGETSISPSYSIISLFGGTYALMPNESMQIQIGNGVSGCYIKLLGSTNIPTIALEIYNPSLLHNTTIINNIYQIQSGTNQTVNISNLNGTVILHNNQPYPIYSNLFFGTTNVSSSSNGYSAVNIFNLSVYPSNATFTSTFNLSYNVGKYGTNIVPFTFINGNWVKVVPYYINPSLGTMQFSPLSNHIFALFAIVNKSIAGNTTSVSTTSTTSIIATTLHATTSSTIPQISSNGTERSIYLVILIFLIVLIIYVLIRLRKKPEPKYIYPNENEFTLKEKETIVKENEDIKEENPDMHNENENLPK